MKTYFFLVLSLASAACFGVELDVETHCLDCHRPAQRRGEVPLIEGQHREYLERQLLRFRERHRDSFPMSAFVAGMNDAALGRLAVLLEDRAWRDADVPVATASARRGAAVAGRWDCAACHGQRAEGIGDIPRLAGQHPGYLARQIKGFGGDERYHPPSGTGAPMRAIAPAEAQDLAAFFSSVEPSPTNSARQAKE